MRRSSYLEHMLSNGSGKATIIRFCCPQDTSHADEHRTRLKGDKAEKFGRAQFRWQDSETGEWLETRSILPDIMRSDKIRRRVSRAIKRQYARKRKELGIPRRRKKRPRPYRHKKAPDAMIPQLPCRRAGCNGNLRLSYSWPLEIEGSPGEEVLKVTLRCGICHAQAYWILPDNVEAIRIGNGDGVRTARRYYEWKRKGRTLRSKTRHTEAFKQRHQETEERDAKLAFERRAKRYGPDIAAKWDTLTPGEKSRLMWASWTPAKRKRVSRKISKGLKQPEVQNIRRGKTKATWEKRKAEAAALKAELEGLRRPADWDAKPIDWRIIGNELLLENGYMPNLELTERLCAGRLLHLGGYGSTPEQIAKSRGFILLANKVRKWVNRPGQEGGPTRRVNSHITSP
jgi:hypothetical protein